MKIIDIKNSPKINEEVFVFETAYDFIFETFLDVQPFYIPIPDQGSLFCNGSAQVLHIRNILCVKNYY